MTFFFFFFFFFFFLLLFVVGLEARREFDLGELRERRRFALPLLARIGGMAVAVAISLPRSDVRAARQAHRHDPSRGVGVYPSPRAYARTVEKFVPVRLGHVD